MDNNKKAEQKHRWTFLETGYQDNEALREKAGILALFCLQDILECFYLDKDPSSPSINEETPSPNLTLLKSALKDFGGGAPQGFSDLLKFLGEDPKALGLISGLMRNFLGDAKEKERISPDAQKEPEAIENEERQVGGHKPGLGICRPDGDKGKKSDS